MSLPHHSLRLRVAAAFSFFVILITGFLTYALLEMTEEDEERLIDQILAREMQHLIDQYRVNQGVTPPRSRNFYGYITQNEIERSALPEVIRDFKPGIHEVAEDGGKLHVLVADQAGARFYLAYDAGYHKKHMERFMVTGAVLFAGIILLSLLLGYYLAGVLIKPVTDLSRRVRTLEPGVADPVLAACYRDKEVVQLAQAFDTYNRRMAESIVREKTFTDGVGHELYVPLTSIRTSCELLLNEIGLSEKGRERLVRVMRAVDRMAELVDALLLMARERRTGEPESISIRSLVEQIAGRFDEKLGQKRVTIEIDIDQNERLTLDRKALDLVVSNLLRNALGHTHDGVIRVSCTGSQLIIADSGEGIEPADLPRIFERFYRGRNKGSAQDKRLGLGLAIVKRICDLNGWSIDVASVPRKGTTITLSFPDAPE